jgi:hypothetical protein
MTYAARDGSQAVISEVPEYEHARKQVEELESLLASVRAGRAGDDGFRDLQEAALVGVIDDVRAEIAEHERADPKPTAVEGQPASGR